MRILMIPIIGTKDLRTDSTALEYRDFIELALKQRKDLWFYVVVPKGLEGYEVFREMDNVTLIVENRRRRRFLEDIDMIDFDMLMDMFNMRYGVYPIDVVLTNKSAIALLLQKALSDVRYATLEDYKKIPVVVYEDRVFARRETHQAVDWQEFVLRSMTYASVKTIVTTRFERDELYEASREYLSPYMMSRLKRNVYVIPRGVNVDEVEKAISNVKKRDKFTIFWGARLSPQKRPEFVFELMLKYYEMGRDVDFLITTPHISAPVYGKLIKELEKRSKKFHVMMGVNRERFLRLCASSHVWISASMYEGFTVGHLEMALTGVPGIVPRRVWSEELFGKDYPLMYEASSFDEAISLLDWVYENYDEAVEIGLRMRDRVKRLYDKKISVERILRLFDYLIENERKKPRMFGDDSRTMQTVDLILRKYRKRGEISLFELLSEFKAFLERGIKISGEAVGSPTIHDIHEYVVMHGWRDKCNNEYPIYEYVGGEEDE